MSKRIAGFFTVMITVGIVSGAAQAAIMGQLGILNTAGINPATSNPWAAGDTYHLIYVTATQRDATSTAIADYNAFVQADATAEGMGSVSWYALGSTATTDAKDNAVITGPVISVFNNEVVATDAADMWDFNFPVDILKLDGNPSNVWTGTAAGGVADAAELGSDPARRHWSAWDSWGPAYATQAYGDLREMVAISQELTVVPEPASLALIAAGGLLVVRRRRS